MAEQTAIIIPARLASTRMPEKLLRADTGRALITYAVEAAEQARAASNGRIAEVLVATDSERIAEVVSAYTTAAGVKARAVMTRANHRSGTDRIAEAAAGLPENITTIINIQGDEPELPAEEILMVADLLEDNPEASMSTLARPIVKQEEFLDPNVVKVVMDVMGFCLYFSRAPIPHDRDEAIPTGGIFGYMHLGIYGYRREILASYSSLPPSLLEEREKLEQLRALGAGLKIVAGISNYTGCGIDSEEDYQRYAKNITRK
ncbi:MAG: 3-deoxy-manno-octulosonate cytidylyltransferase [Planctomycetes bacterium]|nr:3-deoxy-manno-octulosonate cytidylyltransferase [Planctomycetota bacterium]